MTGAPRPAEFVVGRPWLQLLFACLFGLVWSCSAAEEPVPLGDPSAASGGAGVSGSGSMAGSGGATVNPLGRARCRAPDGVSDSPQNTQQTLQLLNALPKPTTVACLVESLSRPLTIYATSSPFSAQPALSVISPRVFIKLGSLWISVVIDGDSSYLVEFGDLVAGEQPRSIKGELLLPVSEAVTPSAPYDRVKEGTGTVCGLCHYDEHHEGSMLFDTAFSSIAFRPRPDSRVSVEALRLQSQLCDWQVEPHRCEMLSAVFGGGDVLETAFPDSMVTFF